MIVSLTVVRYRKRFIPFALLALAIHRRPLRLQKGCTFWKLLGSGKDGTVSLNPDWQQWALLAVWESREDFADFYDRSSISKWWNSLGVEKWTILCEPLQSRGKWDKKEPFGNYDIQNYTGPMIVLTRATVRLKRLRTFWAHVGEVEALMKRSPGYITSMRIGETHHRISTFSVWDNLDCAKAFAYKSREHTHVIRKAKDEAWHSEELFARLKPLAAFGSIKQQDPLKGLIKFEEL